MKNLLKVAVVALLLTMAFVVNSCSSGLDEIESLKNDNPELVETGNSISSESSRAVTSAELNEPLTLEFARDGKITITNPWSTLRYKKNDGNIIAAVDPNNPSVCTIKMSQGDKICFYAVKSENTYSKTMNIDSTSDCYLYGNIMSLVTFDTNTGNWDPNYKYLRESYTFCELFRENKHIKNHSSKQICLPANNLKDNCYCRMFESCTSLTTAPELPATNLAEACYAAMFYYCESLINVPKKLPATWLYKHCYMSMFFGCIALTTAPELPAQHLDTACYECMFYLCRSLTTAPKLPATTLASECYDSMFGDCYSLTEAPELPAKTLDWACYRDMFIYCTSLKKAPVLPATQLEERCYASMFFACRSLTTAPKLPATTLTDSCYRSMFENCTSLTNAPYLPADTLSKNCYEEMFKGCKNLNFIQCLATDISASECTKDWVYDVPVSGTFVKVTNAVWPTGNNGIPNGWTIKNIETKVPEYDEDPLTLEFIEDGTIKIINPWSTLMYSVNGENVVYISAINNSPFTITVKKGDKICFYAEKSENTYSKTMNINSTSDCYLYGNIMSLVTFDITSYTWNPKYKILHNSYTFAYLFEHNNHIKNHHSKQLLLPAETLTSYCYIGLFYACTSLTKAPSLPATTLNPFCYDSMFKGCSSLTNPPILPAKTLSNGCYQYMFKGCKNLNYIECLATDISAKDCTNSWVEGVSSSGTFIISLNTLLKWQRGNNGIPNNWTVIRSWPIF